MHALRGMRSSKAYCKRCEERESTMNWTSISLDSLRDNHVFAFASLMRARGHPGRLGIMQPPGNAEGNDAAAGEPRGGYAARHPLCISSVFASDPLGGRLVLSRGA